MGLYLERYATNGGDHFVLSASEHIEGVSDQMRIEVVDARSGATEQTVKVPEEDALLWLAPSLSTDRYAAILGSVLPNTDDGPHPVKVVDLETGEVLDLDLKLGEVP